MPYIRSFIAADGIKFQLVEGFVNRQFQAIDAVAPYNAGLRRERVKVNAGLGKYLAMPVVVITLADLLLLLKHIGARVVYHNLIDGITAMNRLERVVIDGRFVEEGVLVVVREAVGAELNTLFVDIRRINGQVQLVDAIVAKTRMLTVVVDARCLIERAMPVIGAVILTPYDAILVVERRPHSQVQTVDRVTALIGLQRLFIRTGCAIVLTTPEVGLLIRDHNRIHVQVRWRPVQNQALNRVTTMNGYQGIEILTWSCNGTTTPMELTPITDRVFELMVGAFIDRQSQFVNTIGTNEGIETIIVHARLVVVFIAMPYEGQILRADGSLFLEVVNRILVQGQFVNRVTPRYGLEVIVVYTFVRIGLLAPEVAFTRIERCIGLEEISRVRLEYILHDTITTTYTQHRVADDTCIVEMPVAEGSAVRLAEGDMHLRVVGRLYGQSMTVNRVATIYSLATIPVDAALVVVLAMPYVRQFALAYNHTIRFVVTLGDTNMQFVDRVATMNRVQAIEICSGVIDTLTMPGLLITITEGHHLLKVIRGSPVQYQFEYRVTALNGIECIVVHARLGILLATEIVLGVMAEDIRFLNEVSRHNRQRETVNAVTTDKGL